mmetsp:Transcript_18770/g.59017  ORF Transcript_18770/g.59017 Transcript_18770/m.59017 type:complete len:108 (-) Transcript_18770:71-394(-)|eukprot:CAMPEP_0204604226 /NCGR_PEP_ID=MMETSP0661-20131031/57734_1 /ASSEMBLY_ACC=CAM_ASM_000606 /TAXON_ID=109239 /ORGANISM="Alexandrium margalefi, Strain AMGDE01CS-322" /LENGTH=107 /DNA_ID=CAMNT_0051615363 /DNA_START=34 /DNA_END=357 /DNA_ORIENTATION=+
MSAELAPGAPAHLAGLAGGTRGGLPGGLEGSLSPDRHPWLWVALFLAVASAVGVLSVFARLQYTSGPAFRRKPEKSCQLREMSSGDADGLDDAEDGWSASRELRRKR